MNTSEAQIHSLIFEGKSVEAEIIAMQAHDRGKDSERYSEREYSNKASRLMDISNRIIEIAKEGYL